mgnify:CR=1 FL=1
MGFIEDERKRKAAELSTQRKREMSYEQQEKEREQREVSERAARQAQAAKSKEQFEQSGLGEMIAELGKLGSHKSARQTSYSDKNYTITITVEEKGWVQEKLIGAYGTLVKEVVVETTADGAIKITGGTFGSTTISKEKWQGKKGQEALEKALGKAYSHPQSRGIQPDSAPPR